MKIQRLSVFVFAALCATSLSIAQSPCDKLKSLALPDTSITAVELVPAGPYSAPSPFAAKAPAAKPQPPIQLPAHCRVALVLTPSKDSHIESEVWIPAESWNGKLQVVGNGGWAGTISFSAMADALREGYATASTDTGHKEGGVNGMFGLGHPEKIIDFGYRALHETTVKAKAIVAALKGQGPKLSYYNGCSTGGRQGLEEATRYPGDFDGIVAGAPANPQIYLHASDIERYMRLQKDPAHQLSRPKLTALHKAILDSCDQMDGVKDGLLENPEKCRFDPGTLLCEGADSDTCLTAAQVEAVKIIFSDIKTKKGEMIWPGFPLGGELQNRSLTAKIDPNAPPSPFSLDSIRIIGYQNPNWDWHTWDLDRDVTVARENAGFDVHSYDLSAFKKRGGKLLLYHGWADPSIPAGNTVNFYKGVLSKMGQKQDDWLRLFMVPGMGHCRGGDGADQFNKMGALERWRELGTAPDRIQAAHVTGGTVDMTRPLCPYPKTAVYRGSGSTADAANFTCK